ncbi:nickel-type superoxide dismutase maturation protease [Streptomyces apocyni]|uniref:nickel-type superoxide dismutase maturation protease n=1 Tax=Streptomyces apocyni TaxID=2654677 RepID=UPI0012EA817D|nr:nickel-type superoxide dismutase maturation protease [Streptomyces apocyni]
MREQEREPGRAGELGEPGGAGDAVRGARVPFGIAEVHGPSMVPTLRHGDRLLVHYGARVRAGDVVVLRHPFQQDLLVVKRAVERREGGWWVLGDNSFAGGDSTDYGTVPGELVLGRVRLRYRPRGRGDREGQGPRGARGDQEGARGAQRVRGVLRSVFGVVGWGLSAVRPVFADRSASSRLRAR